MKKFIAVLCGIIAVLPLRADDLGLFKACMEGDVGQVKTLLKDGADANVNISGISILMFAVNAGQSDIVKILVDAGSDVNYKNEEGISPLAIASYLGDDGIITALLSKDISVDDKTVASHIALLQNNEKAGAILKEVSEYGKLEYRKLRRDEYQKGARFRVFFKVSHIFVGKDSVYRAVCHLKETKAAEANTNYEFYVESKERFSFIEGDMIEALVTYEVLENVEVSVLPYRAVEQALFQIDKILQIW